MAYLKRSIRDNHLYILAGQSQGTWQVNEDGEKWLQRENYAIPHPGEGVSLDSGTYRHLRDKGYLYTHNIPYGEHDLSVHPRGEITPPGLPLLLHLSEEQHPAWTLQADISKLAEDEKVWNELQQCQASLVTMSCTTQLISKKQLLNTFCSLKIWPQAQIYRVQWLGDHNKSNRQLVQAAPQTPGLLDNWQGNVFTASTQKTNLWYHCPPGSTISLTNSILWLAKNGRKPDWPGKALVVEHKNVGWPQELRWQLWELTLTNSMPILLEKVTKWLSYRSIEIVPQRQGLRIISPLEAVTNDYRFISVLEQPLCLQCDPPRRQIGGVTRQVHLSVTKVNDDSLPLKNPNLEYLEQLPTDQVSYFTWEAQRPGRYCIELTGDARAEPLHIQITTKSLARPQWLQGLSCTVTSMRTQQIFHAFKDRHHTEQGEKEDELQCFSLQELSNVTWSFEPNGLPLRISWESISRQEKRNRGIASPIQSGEELTACWQKDIWPNITTNTKTKITLDAGSFGLLELAIVRYKEDRAWWADPYILAQIIWLSHAATRDHDQPQRVVPHSLRKAISQLRSQTSEHILLYTALQRLLTISIIPSWVLFRLHLLITEIQQRPKEIVQKSSIQYYKSHQE